jgi:hypothetical protein
MSEDSDDDGSGEKVGFRAKVKNMYNKKLNKIKSVFHRIFKKRPNSAHNSEAERGLSELDE